MRTVAKLACFAVIVYTLSWAAAAAEHGTFVRAANIYISPDSSSARLATIERGREAVLLERTPGWVHVVVTLTGPAYNPDPEENPGHTATGWIEDKGYITESTHNGDQILFGEAADSEDQASQRLGRPGAAADAQRLYYRVFDLFPKSPLAAEALYRAADVQWQLDREALRSRHKSEDPEERPAIDDQLMRLVHKKFPATQWDELAAYEMLENKLCGDWTVSANCAEREAEVYEKYATEHPDSPRATQALYNASYRWAGAITIYAGGQSKKISEAAKHALADAQRLLDKNATPEWNARAQRLIYLVQQKLPIYGGAAQ